MRKHHYRAITYGFILVLILHAIGVNAGKINFPGLPPQQLKVEGIVTSQADNVPLPGVAIMEKGTQNGTITDLDGKYTINVSGSEAILEVRFLGFKTETAKVGTQSQINFALVPSVEQLDEVQVIGYGIMKKSDVTGSITYIRSDKEHCIAATCISIAR